MEPELFNRLGIWGFGAAKATFEPGMFVHCLVGHAGAAPGCFPEGAPIGWTQDLLSSKRGLAHSDLTRILLRLPEGAEKSICFGFFGFPLKDFLHKMIHMWLFERPHFMSFPK